MDPPGGYMTGAGQMTIGTFLERAAECTPDLHAIEIWPESDSALLEKITYSELQVSANAFAALLFAHAVRPGSRVAIVAATGRNQVLALYACAVAGAISVPLNPDWTQVELAGVLDRVRPTVVLADDRIREKVAASSQSYPVLILNEIAEASDRVPSDWRPPQVSPSDPCEIVFTSGTTASPKGVLLSHQNCLGGAIQAGQTVGWGRRERFFSALPLFHVNAQTFCLWSALVWEGTAILSPVFSASQYARQIDSSSATVTSLVSTQVKTMLRQPSFGTIKPRSIRHVVYAINIPNEERRQFEDNWGIVLRNGYGLSEAMTLIAMEPSWGSGNHWPSVGFPAAGRTIRVVRDDGSIADVGEVGELQIRGVPGVDVMLGYWEDQAATNATWSGEWLRTGDLFRSGRWGELYFVGRSKEVIKVAGENVSVAEVEQTIMEFAGVLEVAVVALPDDIRDEAVGAAVVMEPPGDVCLLEAYLRERLATYKLPRSVLSLDALPRTSIGKVDKVAVREQFAKQEV